MADDPKDPDNNIAAKFSEMNTDLMERLAEEAREQIGKRGSYKRTPELIEELIFYMHFGLSIEAACKSVGISPMTLSRWRKDDPELDDEIEAAAELSYEALEAKLISISSKGRWSTKDKFYDKELCANLRWIMSKRNRKYSDRVDVTSNGNTLPAVILPTIALPSFPVEAEFNEVVEIEDHSNDD